MLLHSARRNAIDIHFDCETAGATKTELGRGKADEWRMVEWVAGDRTAIR